VIFKDRKEAGEKLAKVLLKKKLKSSVVISLLRGGIIVGQEVSKGDILTDGDWGLMYYLDSQTMPRMAQKKFFVESAKRELRNLLDEQLSEQDLDSFKIPGQPRGSLRGIVGSRKMVNKSGGFNLEKRPEYVGFVAEVIVKNLFQQLRFDGVLDVRVVEGDVYQDAVEKIDFIIHTKQILIIIQ